MRRFIVIAIVVGILAALVVTAIMRSGRNRPQVVTLPDGTRVQLLGVAVGGQQFSTEKPWEKKARKILPRAWQKWIPTPATGSCGSGTNSITVFFQVQLPTNNVMGVLPWQSFVAQDAAGFEYHRSGGYCSFGGGAGRQKLYGLTLRAFPRRQPRFTFQLLDSQDKVMAKFDVENPIRGPFAEWQPAPLPQTQTNGPVTLTLKSLHQIGNASHPYVQAQWQVTATDTNWSKAKARFPTLTDATGNEGQWLSPREKAWKLRTEVFREYLENFSTNEYLVLTNVPVPGPGENVLSPQAIERGGVTLKIHALGGPGAIANTNGSGWFMMPERPPGLGHSTTSDGKTTIEKYSSLKPFLLFEAQGVQSGDEIRVQARDDQGQEVRLEDTGYSSRSSSSRETRTYVRRILIAPEIKVLDLEIIVNRPLQFEFIVNPAEVKSGKK